MTDLGKVMILPKGEWSSDTSYEILDSVTYQGKAYISKVDANTHTPSGSSDTYWFMYAQDGETPQITVSAKSDGKSTITIVHENTTDTIEILDGTSVTIKSITKVEGTTTVKIEDVNGEQTIIIEDGKGIADFTKNSNGLTDTYTITYTDKTTSQIIVTNGKGISKIEKTKAEGLIDTYTITFNDNSTLSYTVSNGKGITSIINTGNETDVSGHVVDIYTINYNDGTTQTYRIVNGKDGTGVGDMTKAVYDADNDGVVDNAAKVNNHTVESDVPQDAVFTDTTYNVFTGASASEEGTTGLVPKPTSSDRDKALFGDGSWKTVADFRGATSTSAGEHGLVPAPSISEKDKYLKGDGSWGELIIPDGLGTKVSATVSGDTVTFTSSDIGENSVIDGPYIKNVLTGQDSVSVDGTSITYTLTTEDADGQAAYIWVRN